MKTIYRILFLLLFIIAAYENAGAAVSEVKKESAVTPSSVEPKQKISQKVLKAAGKQYKELMKGMKMQEKRAFLKMKIEQDNKKVFRLPLLLTALGFILLGALLIFLAYTSIGYLGFIAAVIGIIALIVWLIFKEADKEL